VVFAIPQDRAASCSKTPAKAAMQVTALDRTRTHAGHRRFASLDNQVDTTTGTVKAKARLPTASSTLFPSQFVNVQLQVRTMKTPWWCR
jgi:multidrug efflux system membrane fusion protein